MEILKKIGWGVLIWVIMFMWVTILMFVFGLETGWLYYILTWIVVILAAWLVAGYAKIKGISDALMTALIWVVVGLLLDWLVTTKFNTEIFASWSLWVGYTLLLLTPIFKVSMKK